MTKEQAEGMDRVKRSKAVEAHTNLNTFAVVVSVLEGGCLYGSRTADITAQKIIKLCQDEMQRQLRIYDRNA